MSLKQYPEKLPLKMREYQKELAEDAIKGRNCIVVAPTGTGKTHVAMYIIQDHLSKVRCEAKQIKKIIFVVPTVALVCQQEKLFQKYLSVYKVTGISGELDLSLGHLLESFDVFVLTPQILVNLLKEDMTKLSLVTLLMFDECHHAKKDHPYNDIMNSYHSIQDKDCNADLPQVVGFTASIGVGKAKDMKQAKDYILTICANLDTFFITTVKKNSSELARATNKPSENTMECIGRSIDPFNEKINELMFNIEKKIQTPDSEIRLQLKYDFEFLKQLKPPSERGCDAYIQWWSRLNNYVSTIYDQKTRQYFAAFVKFLDIYNNSLLINADCRTKDAIVYIDGVMNDFKDVPDSDDLYNKITISLKQQWESLKCSMRAVCVDSRYDNPKLNVIKNILYEGYNKNSDLRCIIFCKTRDMTVALVNWIKESPELSILKPANLVGTNAPANKAGQTSAQQEDVLKYFKDGEHKVIIATSVAEEGLDVQKCNLVVRYEHVTNSIARVQCRGRARYEDAASYLIAERGKGIAMKEEINAIREKMMNNAIIEIQDMRSAERKKKIKELQLKSKVSRKMVERGKQIASELKKRKITDKLYEIRCLNCDQLGSLSSNVRKVENTHHVVIDPDIIKRVNIRPYPKSCVLSPIFESTGKIYCKKCNSDWGIMALYHSIPFPVIKIRNFIVRCCETENQAKYKKWKDIPFNIDDLTDKDLVNMAERNLELFEEFIPTNVEDNEFIVLQQEHDSSSDLSCED